MIADLRAAEMARCRREGVEFREERLDALVEGYFVPGGYRVSSGGTTGEPKVVVQSAADLQREVESWCELMAGARRVVALIPAHHLYGLVWTVLWPEQAGMEVVDWRGEALADVVAQCVAGDVVVGVPVQWEGMAQCGVKFGAGVWGVSSAGRLEDAVWVGVRQAGLGRMVEVYGSTESGGVATRESEREELRVARHWWGREEELLGVLPDWVELRDGGLRVLGRKDGAVKVAGWLVELEQVRAWVMELAGVADCHVRVREGRLEMFVAGTTAAEEIREMLGRRLPGAVVPRRIETGARVPRDGMGKFAW